MPNKVLGKKFLAGKLQALGLVTTAPAASRTASAADGSRSAVPLPTLTISPLSRTISSAPQADTSAISGSAVLAPGSSVSAAKKTSKKDHRRFGKNSKKSARDEKHGNSKLLVEASAQAPRKHPSASDFSKSWSEEHSALTGPYLQRGLDQSEDENEINMDQISIPERPGTPTNMSVRSLPMEKNLSPSIGDPNRFATHLVRSRSFRVGEQEEYCPPGSCADLKSSVRLTMKAVNLFFDNQMIEAQQLLKPHVDSSLYAALTYSAIRFFQAVMTMDREDVSGAQESLQATMDFCDTRRQRSRVDKMTSVFRSRSMKHLSEEQIHAELCYAECGLMKAFLVFMSDENLVSFIKGGWKIHTCYSAYKDCSQLLMTRTWDDDELKAHFESGVRLGYGAFNLIFSSLPPRVLSLLKMVGFSGDRDLGIRELQLGLETDGMRSVLCRFTLIAWNAITCYIIGNGEGDLSAAARLLQPVADAHPTGAIILFLYGRLEELQGNVDVAVKYFMRSACVQDQWLQFHHLNYWEMTWCYVYTQQWMAGATKTALLLRENDWSKAMYAYMCAGFLIMQQQKSITSKGETFTVDGLMEMIPALKQRFAGHSIPIEKFVVRKSRRYFAQNKWLLLPVFEAAYLWTGWVIIGRSCTLLRSALTLIEAEERRASKRSEQDAQVKQYYYDNKALATFLRGCTFSYLEQYEDAERCFCSIFENSDNIVEDRYIVPYAFMEMAALKLCSGDARSARMYLQEGKKFTNFSLESRYNFRARALDEQITQVESRRLSASNVRLQWFTPPATPRTSLTDLKLARQAASSSSRR